MIRTVSAIKYDLAWLIVVTLSLTLIGSCADAVMGQCPPGQQCATGNCDTLDVGGWRAPAIQRPRFVVPVYFGTDPTPGAGIYIGTIRGRGITLTCLHAAKHSVRSVAGADVLEVTVDKFGYDMVAVHTRPLSLPGAVVARVKLRIGQAVRIIGYPAGRLCERRGRIRGWFRPEAGQRFGDVTLDVPSSDGDSGGAVLDDQGNVVAMIWGTAADSTACISHEAIADFLARLEVMLGDDESEPPIPLPVTDEPVTPPVSDGIAELRVLVEANAAAIAVLLEAAKQPGIQGERGEKGDRGLMGLPGTPGADAVVTPEQIRDILAGYTITVEFGDGAGKVASTQQVPLIGGVLRIPGQQLRTYRLNGEEYDTSTAPLGFPVGLNAEFISEGE